MTDEQEPTADQDALVKTSANIPRYLYEWVKEQVHRKTFNSQSIAITIALAEMKGRMEVLEERKSAKQNIETTEQRNKKIEEGYVTFILKVFSQNPNLLLNDPGLIDELNEMIREGSECSSCGKKVLIE